MVGGDFFEPGLHGGDGFLERGGAGSEPDRLRVVETKQGRVRPGARCERPRAPATLAAATSWSVLLLLCPPTTTIVSHSASSLRRAFWRFFVGWQTVSP